MSKKRIEDQFHTALGEYASVIDEDQLWNEIEHRVPRKKKKKRAFLWFAFGLPILLLMGSVFWFSISETNQTSDNLEKEGSDTKVNHLISESIAPNNQKNEHTETPINAIDKTQSVHQNSNESTKESDLTSKRNRNVFNIDTDISLPLHDRIEYTALKKVKDQNTQSNKVDLLNIQKLPTLSSQPIFEDLPFVKIQSIRSQQPRRIKPKRKSPSFFALNYFAGTFKSTESKSSVPEIRYVDFGIPHFSQGLSISYNTFITSRLYAKASIAGDWSYKKYTDQVQRDTLVPSSAGTQIITYNEYQNGVIDTESGIPIVKGVLDHDVINLNTLSSLSVGLGLGYIQPLGKWNINLEGELQKTMYYNLSGLGRERASQNIINLDSFQNYFSPDSKLTLLTQLGLEYALFKSISVTGGVQYQYGISSLLLPQTLHEEKINLLRGTIGFKWYLQPNRGS